MPKLTTNNSKEKLNMTPIITARKKVEASWSKESTAQTNINTSLHNYAQALDNNGLGIVALVNADKQKSKWEAFEKKYGDLFTRDLWESAHQELATLRKLWRKYYADGAQTFEAWLQNFKLKLMLVQGSKQPTKGSETMKRRKDNRPLFTKVLKAYKDSRPAKTEASDTVKITKKAKSIGVRLDQVVEMLDVIKGLESDTGKKKVETILTSIETLRTKVSALESK
tara:strand:- start:384 stop:1058 length:675 start_codon:yes stop_codon:yes gene_type:complete